MAGRRLWTKEEDLYLEDNVGKLRLQTIAKRLGRTLAAVESRILFLGIGHTKIMSGRITANELAIALGIDSHAVKRWIKSHGLKAVTKATRAEAKFHLISIDDFWKWAEANKEKINFSRIETDILAPEPEWVEVQRKIDTAEIPKKHRKPWNEKETQRLMELFNQGRCLEEIAQLLNRTEKGIQRKISRLKEQRLLPYDKILLPWKKKELQLMLELENQGLEDSEIAIELGRTEKQVSWKRLHLRSKGLYDGYKKRVNSVS
ncbi:hypothetical protein P9E76_01630 [Schinkia azotoformans]|uniref:Uncharacterized protein n=1 Tax=Schinkia azotoformans LMG 9581 TaxID=1131731 RepID=K6C9P7_SCHAZ|nr:hypothetical protein [Schinkia azotoformans]EKN67860.1 hypothetical protein BAZO_08259 [Schinkia azotoformans LMG 9581]MEC1637375.1 hypothetical protein [Schinkia azotoformans]MEC1943779.1 hypothetical protein [Schinkia azotoformans]